MHIQKRSLAAIATFIGTIIGVGMFGLPYVGSRSGFCIFLVYLVGISFLSMAIHLFYAEVTVKTKELHRLPGYANMYFGAPARRAAFILQVASLYGSLLAYLIVGGQFLAALFNGSIYLYTFIFFLVGAFFIWRGSKSISSIELALLAVFFAIIIALLATGVVHVSFSNLMTVHFNNFFLPYGVILFAMWGTSIVPDIKEIVDGDRDKLRRIIITGLIVCFSVYLLFSTLVIGVTGPQTTQEAIAGLKNSLGQWVITAGLIAGIIATFTSFITLGLTLEKTYRLDYHLPKWLAWTITTFGSLFLFILGLKNFIEVISLNGAVMLALEAVMITMMYMKIKKKEHPDQSRKTNAMSMAIIILLLAGVIAEIFYFFNTP